MGPLAAGRRESGRSSTVLQAQEAGRFYFLSLGRVTLGAQNVHVGSLTTVRLPSYGEPQASPVEGLPERDTDQPAVQASSAQGSDM